MEGDSILGAQKPAAPDAISGANIQPDETCKALSVENGFADPFCSAQYQPRLKFDGLFGSPTIKNPFLSADALSIDPMVIRASLVKRWLTPELISSLPGTAGLSPLSLFRQATLSWTLPCDILDGTQSGLMPIVVREPMVLPSTERYDKIN